MDWTQIARLDPSLAGSIAARDHEWWDAPTADEQADATGLQGEQRVLFLAAWHEETAATEAQRKLELWHAYDATGNGYDKGDPAYRTSWQ